MQDPGEKGRSTPAAIHMVSALVRIAVEPQSFFSQLPRIFRINEDARPAKRFGQRAIIRGDDGCAQGHGLYCRQAEAFEPRRDDHADGTSNQIY